MMNAQGLVTFAFEVLGMRAQVVPVDVLTDSAALLRALVLIEAKMNAAVDARVRDVLSDRSKRPVGEGDAERHTRNGDRPMAVAVKTVEHLASSVAERAVSRRIAREAWCRDE